MGVWMEQEGVKLALSKVFEGEDMDAFSSIISLCKHKAVPQVDRLYIINRQRNKPVLIKACLHHCKESICLIGPLLSNILA